MIVTIGAFDGFHKGHAQLLRQCYELADGTDWGVISFHPHPHLPRPLFTLKERELIRRILGIPHMYFLEFSEALRRLPPYDFWRLIHERFEVDGLVMGRDFHFGLNRAGNADYLSRLARYDGVNKVVIADLFNKTQYSSSRIRTLTQAGQVREAAELLGYPPFMISRILHGNARGRTMSFPTANLDISDRTAPASGVYACAVCVDGELHCGALSIGTNPTFGDVMELRCEVHILEFEGNIYGQELGVFFLGRVRDIQDFAHKEELARQIGKDIDTCRRIFARSMRNEVTRAFLLRAQELSEQKLTSEVVRLV